MTLNIVPVEQWTAQMIAGEVIAETAGSDASKRVTDANIALEWASGIQAIADGNPTDALAALTAQLGRSNLDPAVINGLQNMLAFGLQQAAVQAQFAKFVPFFGTTAVAIADNVASGVTAAANIEISKYTPQLPSSSISSSSSSSASSTATAATAPVPAAAAASSS